MPTAVCPGSFDPVTYGHVDIVSRAAALFDKVIVAVLVNDAKRSFFSVDERIAMLSQATADMGGVEIGSFSGLLVDFCAEQRATTIVKGLRATGDFDYELQMAQMNANLSGVETVFLPTSPQWSFVSSSLVKEVARFGGDVSRLVPSYVLERLNHRLAE